MSLFGYGPQFFSKSARVEVRDDLTMIDPSKSSNPLFSLSAANSTLISELTDNYFTHNVHIAGQCTYSGALYGTVRKYTSSPTAIADIDQIILFQNSTGSSYNVNMPSCTGNVGRQLMIAMLQSDGNNADVYLKITDGAKLNDQIADGIQLNHTQSAIRILLFCVDASHWIYFNM